MKKGLEILGISIVADAYFSKESFVTGVESLGFNLISRFCDAKQFTGLTHCQARNKETLAFAFNMSLSSINVARAYARED